MIKIFRLITIIFRLIDMSIGTKYKDGLQNHKYLLCVTCFATAIMTIALVVTLVTILVVTNIPTVVPLKCDEVDFCKTLRSRSAVNTYIVDPYTIDIDDIGIIRFQLVTIAEGDNLQVEIFAYKDDIIRIKIKDLESTRYELADIFAGAPSLAGYYLRLFYILFNTFKF